MIDMIANYADKITSLGNIGMLATLAGAYRAYCGSLSEVKLRTWIDERNNDVNKYLMQGSPIFTIPMVLQSTAITLLGVIGIAIGLSQARTLEIWRVSALVICGMGMISIALLLLCWSHKPNNWLDRWQLTQERKTWRSDDHEVVRHHLHRSGFVFIAAGVVMQMLDNIIGQGTISLWKLTGG